MSRGGFYYDPGQSNNPLPKNQYDVAPVTRGVYQFVNDAQLGFGAFALQSANTPADTQPTLQPVLDARSQDLFPQLWVIYFDPNVATRQGWNRSNTATIRQIESGKYLTLEGGVVTYRIGMDNGAPGSQQHFYFISAQGLTMIVQNDSVNGSMYYVGRDPADPTKLILSATLPVQSNQFVWEVKKVSLSKSELEYALKQVSNDVNDPSFPNHFHSLAVDVEYIPIRENIVREIHRQDIQTNGTFTWRPEIYDCDDFGVAFKNAVARWSYRKFIADGFSVLIGMVFGRNPTGGHVFNWFITWDPNGNRVIKFFEPQANPDDANAIRNYPFGYNLEFGYY